MLKRWFHSPEVCFTLPVILENVATVMIGLVFSSIIGGISISSLAAVGLVNTVVNVLISASQFVVQGGSMLTARLVGEGNYRETSRAVEQSLLLSTTFGLVLAVACELFAVPVMRMLMPSVEPSVFAEGLIYYRVVILSFPFLLISNAAACILRATGISGGAMISGILNNVVQIIVAYILISILHLDLIGAGLSFVICRAVGMVFLLILCLRSHRHFHVRLRSMFRPAADVIRRILKPGLPMALEAVSVQFCYLLTNSIAVNLGTLEAGAFQVVNTLTSFSGLPMGICSTISITLLGQLLGAHDVENAKRKQRSILIGGLLISLFLAVLLAILGPVLVPIYTRDAYIRQTSSMLLWVMIFFTLPGLCINVNDSILKVGGDARAVMVYTSVCVWLIRLPLTWLFCFPLRMGALGVILANVINVVVRAICGFVRIARGAWLTTPM